MPSEKVHTGNEMIRLDVAYGNEEGGSGDERRRHKPRPPPETHGGGTVRLGESMRAPGGVAGAT